METKNILESGHKQVLSLTWELDGNKCHTDTFLIWRGNRLRVKVLSLAAFMYTCIRFEFSFNYEEYAYTISYSNETSAKVQIPDLCYENYRLVIKALPKSLEIHERIMNPNLNPEGEIRNRINNKIYFISVTKNLMTLKHEKLHSNTNLLLWIHKSYDHRYDASRDMYKYHFLSSDCGFMNLKEGNFTCLRVTDIYQRIDGRDNFTVKGEISDNKNTVRSFIGNEEMENGVIEVIKLMLTLKEYYDWEDYDYRKALSKSIGESEWGKMSN